MLNYKNFQILSNPDLQNYSMISFEVLTTTSRKKIPSNFVC